MWTTTNLRATLRRYLFCVLVLATSLIAAPLLALVLPLPRVVRNLLFFWPQYLLVPSGLTDRAGATVVLRTTAIYVAILFWLVLLAAYVTATRRAATAWVVVGAAPFAFAVLQLAIVPLLRLLGLGFVLDGP